MIYAEYTQISFFDMFFLIFFLGGERNIMKYSQGDGEGDCFIWRDYLLRFWGSSILVFVGMDCVYVWIFLR